MPKIYWQVLQILLDVYSISGIGASIAVLKSMTVTHKGDKTFYFEISASPYPFILEILVDDKNSVMQAYSGEWSSQNGPTYFQQHSQATGFIYSASESPKLRKGKYCQFYYGSLIYKARWN